MAEKMRKKNRIKKREQQQKTIQQIQPQPSMSGIIKTSRAKTICTTRQLRLHRLKFLFIYFYFPIKGFKMSLIKDKSHISIPNRSVYSYKLQ